MSKKDIISPKQSNGIGLKSIVPSPATDAARLPKPAAPASSSEAARAALADFFKRAGRRSVALFLLSALAGLVGCGASADSDRLPVFPVKGRIAIAGKPAHGAFVVLHPKGAAARADVVRPHARVNEDGTFDLSSYETSDGAPAGQYAVTVQWNKLVRLGRDVAPGPNVLAAKYGQPETSPLTVEIAEGTNHLPLLVVR